MTLAVLDASALLVFLLDEPGAERVREVLADAAMTTVNLSEVVGHFARGGAGEPDIRDVLSALPVEWIPFDDDLAYAAGLLIAVTKSAGLSHGDRACLAQAHRLGAKALTADRAWTKIARAVSVDVELVR
jgi:ribonuclease VapC